MEKLLQWSIALANNDEETMRRIGAPDPKAIAELFGVGGPDEPTLMKEAITIITSPETSLESKEIAFDNFEMLVENLDNANNIGNMKLWDAILSQLKPGVPSSLQKYACLVIGTATQNNEKSQKDLVQHDHVILDLITLYGASDEATKLKVLYAISNFIRHNTEGYGLFKKHGGWDFIGQIKKDMESTKSDKLSVRLNLLLLSVLSSGESKEKVKYLRGIFGEEEVQKLLHAYD